MKREIVSFSIDSKLLEQFRIITAMKGIQRSEIIEESIKNYVITNKAGVNEFMLNYWKNIDRENNNTDEK